MRAERGGSNFHRNLGLHDAATLKNTVVTSGHVFLVLSKNTLNVDHTCCLFSVLNTTAFKLQGYFIETC